MTKIWERLFIGGIADAEELADDNPFGISTVISLSELPVEGKRRGVNYVHVPVTDDEPVPVHQFDGMRMTKHTVDEARGSVL